MLFENGNHLSLHRFEDKIKPLHKEDPFAERLIHCVTIANNFSVVEYLEKRLLMDLHQMWKSKAYFTWFENDCKNYAKNLEMIMFFM